MWVVISDASPIRYLLMIGEIGALPKLYGRVFIPSSVAHELNRSRTPDLVREWILAPPSWLEIVSPPPPPVPLAADLDEGERDAISLALDLKADLVLMDDREGVEEAIRLGLKVTGTLGVLDRAAALGLLDLRFAVERLRDTNFRASTALLDHLLAEDSQRRKE
jgi:predicted nucleic acid-binding protein